MNMAGGAGPQLGSTGVGKPDGEALQDRPGPPHVGQQPPRFIWEDRVIISVHESKPYFRSKFEMFSI